MNKQRVDRGIRDIQVFLRQFLEKNISYGDMAVDATAGLGRDTLFLAQCVGDKGKVFAFDIQEQAIKATQELLQEQGLAHRVQLLAVSHSEIAKYVPPGIQAAVFNLGYLPGFGKKIVTRPETTLQALTQVLKLLKKNGLVAITVYRGHEGGLEESETLISYLSKLPKQDFSVLQGIYLNQGEESPYWIIIQKN
ncbi:MAG TPA: methyltransferase domain-containing protein [Peptococcaceae bacterium]|nr:methyltransferase domain-containing protein [Peptococcaceae bacterium]